MLNTLEFILSLIETDKELYGHVLEAFGYDGTIFGY